MAVFPKDWNDPLLLHEPADAQSIAIIEHHFDDVGSLIKTRDGHLEQIPTRGAVYRILEHFSAAGIADPPEESFLPVYAEGQVQDMVGRVR